MAARRVRKDRRVHSCAYSAADKLLLVKSHLVGQAVLVDCPIHEIESQRPRSQLFVDNGMIIRTFFPFW